MTKKKEAKVHSKMTAWIQHISLSILYGVLFFFLIANIILSQQFPTIYYSVVSGNTSSLVELFKRGRTLLPFEQLFPEIKSTFSAHEGQIYGESRTRKELITKLELLLKENPKSRDILYSLYLLYDKEGDENRALEYLKSAQQIDPAVKS